MTGWKKLLFGAVIVGAGLLLAVFLLIKIYVTPERVHDLIQSGLEKSLQRKVSLGAVDVGLFSGIQLAKLSILTKNEKDILLSAENIELSYDFMRLFRGELLLGHILIKEPQLRLVRESDGRLNIDDLFAGQAVSNDASSSGTGNPKGDASAKIPFLVKQFSMQGGTLQFIDRKLNLQSPYRYRLEKLDINVEDFSLQQPFLVRLAADLNDSPLAMELQYDFADGLQTLGLHAHQLNMVPFLPYFQDALPGSFGQGVFSTELQIRKHPAGFAAKGQIVFDHLDLRLALDKSIHWNEVRIAMDQDLLYRPLDQVVDFKELHVDINGVQVGYRGRVLLAEPLQIDGEGDLKVVDLRKITDLIPLELREQVATYAVAGSLEATMQIQGQPTGLDVVRQASLKVIDVQASLGELRPALNGTINYSAGRVQAEQLKIDLNGQLLLVDMQATKKTATLPDLQLVISGEKLNLDALIPQQKGADQPVVTAKSEKKTAAKAQAVKSEPLVLPVDGSIKVQVSQLLYQGLIFEKVRGGAILHNGKLSLQDLSAGLAGGTVDLTAEADLVKERIPLRGHLGLSGIELSVLTDALMPDAQGSISGALTADSAFSGYGQSADILTALNASGNFELRDGEIKGSPFLAEFSQFLSNPELEVLGFRRFYGSYGLNNRQGTIDAKLESRRVFLAPQGTYSLDGPLNISLEARISPELMAKSGIGGKGVELLKDEKGWSLLPLKVKGNYTKPRIILDSSGLTQQIKQGVASELGRQLQKKLGGTAEDQKNQDMQKLLDGTLKKLFGH